MRGFSQIDGDLWLAENDDLCIATAPDCVRPHPRMTLQVKTAARDWSNRRSSCKDLHSTTHTNTILSISVGQSYDEKTPISQGCPAACAKVKYSPCFAIPSTLICNIFIRFFLCTVGSMAYRGVSLWRLCLLSLPFASALTIPQEPLVKWPEDQAIDNDVFNITDYTSLDDWNPKNWDYDVVIVGGGPAGLAASMSLARVARTSLLYDSQEYRNEQTRYMHDVLGQDGKSTTFHVRRP